MDGICRPEGTGILDLYLPLKSELTAEYQPKLLDGLTTIRGQVALRKDRGEGMYRTLDKPEWETVETQFVPYYAWCNRGQSEMTVWMLIVWE